MVDLRALGPSVIRTVTPWLVGLLVALLGRVGLEWEPSPEAYAFAATLVSAAYYAAVRWLETRRDPRWGWLLGVKGAPLYASHDLRPAAPNVTNAVPVAAPPSMPLGRVAWGVVLGVAGLLELYGIVHPGPDDTLSELTRWVFNVDTSTGQLVFGVAWVGFAAWFLVHIIGVKRRR